jgi:hypothetical protein
MLSFERGPDYSGHAEWKLPILGLKLGVLTEVSAIEVPLYFVMILFETRRWLSQH